MKETVSNPKIIFLSQSAGEIVFELAERCTENFGETVFITGSKFKSSNKSLEIIDAPKYKNYSYFSRLKTLLAKIVLFIKDGCCSIGRYIFLQIQ